MPFDLPVHTLQAAFSRGEVSPYLFGRVDLAGWGQGLRTLRNFTVRREGSVSNRPGFAYLGQALTANSKGSVLLPFVFSATQSYVIEVGAGTSQVFSNGALISTGPNNFTAANLFFLVHPSTWAIQYTTAAPHGLTAGQNVSIVGVTGTGAFASANGTATVLSVIDANNFVVAAHLSSGTWGGAGGVGGPSVFSTPWAAGDLAGLRWSQSADTLTVVHPKYPPYEIKRTSANSFSCTPATYSNGPFLTQNTDGTTFVYASAKSGTVTLNATAPIFNANHVGALFQLTQQDLSGIEPWEPTKQFSGSSIIGQYRRASLKNYLAVSLVSPPGTFNCTGTWIPSHSQGVQADGDGQTVPGVAAVAGVNWLYQDSGFGVVKITAYVSPTQVTGVVQPNYTGGPGLLPIAVVGGPVTAVGPWTFSGDGSTTTFALTSPNNTSSDQSKFYVTIGGVYQSPALYTISAASGGNIVFFNPPPVGTNNIVVKQITALGQTSYWAFGAFSADQGYPSAVSYFPDRLVLAATPAQPVGVFGSKTSQYHDFGVSNPVVASDAFTVFLNARQLNAISDLLPLSDLLVGTSNIIWRLWPGSTGVALSPLAIAATPQSYYGECPSCAGVLFGDSAIFPEYDGRRLRDLIYQFAFDKFIGQELTLYSQHLIPFGTQFQRLTYKPDPQGQLVFGLLTNGELLACTYLREQQVIGWAHWDTPGTFEDICVVPEGTQFGLYALTNRTIGGVQQRMVERLSNREVQTVYDYHFLDCNLTYDGRNTTSVTMQLTGGTTWLAGDTGTLAASTAAGWVNFASTDPANNNEIWLYDASGNRVRLLITAYTSPTQVSVRLKDPCPASLRNTSTAVWTFARTTFTGATQLANAAVVALVDANVVGIGAKDFAPNGSLSVAFDGSITLPNAGGVVQVGLSYLSDFETLPLNLQGQETIRMRSKTVPIVYLDVTEARNFLAGTAFDNTMLPQVQRAFEPYLSPTNLADGVVWTRLDSVLDAECHTCIRQNMPLPLSIRGHIPQIGVGEPIG